MRNGPLPAGLGRERSRDERVRWFLSSIYCSCRIPFNTCTGQYFTLAGCNPKTCGMPNMYRGKIEEFIDQGLDDGQILAELQKKYGDIIRRPHLRP